MNLFLFDDPQKYTSQGVHSNHDSQNGFSKFTGPSKGANHRVSVETKTYAINSRKYTLLSPHPPHLVFSAVSLSPNLVFGEKNRGKERYKHAGAPEAHKLWLLVLNLIIIFQHAFI